MNRHFKKTLGNGLRVVCIPQLHLHACEVSCYVGVGSRHEPEDQAGISHFLEHMLFRGTEEYPSSLELERAFEALGGGANAATDAESTCFFSRFHPEKVTDGIALFASMLQRPLLQDLEVERSIILEEAQEDFNEEGKEINPDTLMIRLLWPKTVLAHPTIGSLETLASMDEAMLRKHHARFYVPANTVIAVAGPVEPEEVFAVAEQAFSGWRGAEKEALALVGEMDVPVGSTWVRDSASQLTVQMAFPLPGRESEHAIGLRIMRRILSGGVASRLMLRLRETLGLTYSIEANLTVLAETGALVIDFLVAPENLVSAVREVGEIIADLWQNPVPEDEFARAVQNYQYDLDFSNDHSDEMVTRYGWGELIGFVRDVDADRQALQRLTSTSLSATIRTCLEPQNPRLVVVGPYRPADRIATEEYLQTFSSRFS